MRMVEKRGKTQLYGALVKVKAKKLERIFCGLRIPVANPQYLPLRIEVKYSHLALLQREFSQNSDRQKLAAR